MAQHFMNRDYGFMGWGYYYDFGYFCHASRHESRALSR